MKVATITLKKMGENSPMLSSTYTESIRSREIDITWAPQHVVFQLYDGIVIALRAEQIVEIYMENE